MGEKRDLGEHPAQARGDERRQSSFATFLKKYKFIAAFLGAVGTATLGVLIPQLIHAMESAASPSHSPVEVNVITDVARFRSGAGYVPLYLIQRPPSAIGAPPNRFAEDASDPHEPASFDPARYAWAHALGGIDADETLLRLSISGTSPAATDLQQIRLRIIRCRAPLPGTEVGYVGIGDSIGTRFFTANLDNQTSTLNYVGTGPRRRPGPQPFPLRVTDSIQEEFDISIYASRYDCQWDLLLDWTQGDRSGTAVITDNGKPFETTATEGNSGKVKGVNEIFWDPKLQRWVTTVR